MKTDTFFLEYKRNIDEVASTNYNKKQILKKILTKDKVVADRNVSMTQGETFSFKCFVFFSFYNC